MSDHADYSQILEYATACGAKTVYLAHGDNTGTARALRLAGFEAYPIEQIGMGKQMVLQV